MRPEPGLRPDLLGLLCCPITHAPLRMDNGELVSLSSAPRRYAVHAGIPIFVHPSDQNDTRSASSIALAFRERSAGYFRSNYQAGGNLGRIARLSIAIDLLETFARTGMRTLDVGAGPAVLAEAAEHLALDYIALDLSLENLLEGRRRAGSDAAIVGDVTALPIRAGSFDIVVALGCLEYVEDLDRAAIEISRVMKPGGRLVASFANARSPGRQWQENVRNPLWRMRERLAGRGATLYRRYLSDEAAVREVFGQHRLAVDRVEYIGSPSERNRTRRPETRASEFLIVAVRR